MKVLITGSNGQLGYALINSSPKSIGANNIEIIKGTRENMNLLNQEKCEKFLELFKPNWIINCGAYTAVDKAESDIINAFKINAEGPYFLAKKCNEMGIKLIQISTDFVFDGNSNKGYETTDKINPINIYGKSKALGEELISKINCKNNIFIIRASWIIGTYGNNFLLKILKLISQKKKLTIVDDQVGCITNVNNLAFIIWKLIFFNEKNLYIPKVLHYSESGFASWFDITNKINKYILERDIFNHKTEIIPVSSDVLNLPAKRPKFSLLNCQETYSLFKFTPPNWEDTITNLLESFDKDYYLNLKNNA